MNTKCNECNVDMIKTINNQRVTINSGDDSKKVEMYICPKCGYIKQYVKINDNSNEENIYEDDEQLVFY